jgi:hypothetical protein
VSTTDAVTARNSAQSTPAAPVTRDVGDRKADIEDLQNIIIIDQQIPQMQRLFADFPEL